MLFNSIEFAFFLPIVFLIYWVIGYAHINDNLKLRLQNAFVVLASYIFYGWWNWRFLLLIAFTSFCSWGSGLLIAKSLTPKAAKAWTAANIVLNLSILAVFKYYDFFVREFGQLFGVSTDSLLLRIILPVGISFYTFQALSYSIDVYRKKIEPTRDIVAFFAYVAFFPQLVADQVWATYDIQTGSTLLLAAILFTFQIYGDFSGYSDIAIGTAKLFGIKLMRNFNNPYFSRDIAEFWRRWHISLTTWFRDYVYIPLGGSRVGKWKIVRNTFVIFLLSGFWHGANWTFIAWGAYHAILFLPLILLGMNRKYTNQVAEGRLLPTWKEALQILVTFSLAVFGWIIFRATGMPSLFHYLEGMLQWGTLRASYRFFLFDENLIYPTNIFILIMIIAEWFGRNKDHALQKIEDISLFKYRYVRYLAFALAFTLIILFRGGYQTFIYFQF